MRQEEQIRLLEGLMRHMDEGTTVDAGCQVRNPVSSYVSEELAAREWDEFFQGHPQVLGLSADLPEPRSFFTSNDLGKPILCTRTKDGVFRGFLNVCRHRGTIVEEERRGQKRLFQCPFHAWTYDHEGNLVSVPKEKHFGDVDRACHSLAALPAVERHGLLFVSPDPNGVLDVDALLGDFGPELASWEIERFVFHGSTRYDHAMNWKLAIDTFGETYHFETLHRDTVATDFYGNVQMYDTFGRHHRMAICLKSIDGLRGKPKETWNVLHGSVLAYYLFPNVQLIMTAGGPTLVRVYPDGANPHQSFSEIGFYLNPRALESQAVKSFAAQHGVSVEQLFATRMEEFARTIQTEDYMVAASGHRGAAAGAQEYLLFGRNEPALHHYHNNYREALGMEPLAPL